LRVQTAKSSVAGRIETGQRLAPGIGQTVTLQNLGDARPPKAVVTEARNVLLNRRECGGVWSPEELSPVRTPRRN
jgi:hypothetical protein